ncbi:hypothetical protein [Azospirillum argentinense]
MCVLGLTDGARLPGPAYAWIWERFGRAERTDPRRHAAEPSPVRLCADSAPCDIKAPNRLR